MHLANEDEDEDEDEDNEKEGNGAVYNNGYKRFVMITKSFNKDDKRTKR
jgi:hypothetical protein